jgi:parallel beta-helix repeat protein
MMGFRHSSRRRRSWVVAVTATAGAVFLVAGATTIGSSGHHAVTPTVVPCGATITVDTALARDLNNCPADGLVVGAPDITIDLNGHTIDGVGVDIGVNNKAGHDDVTVKNGTVHEFMEGIQLGEAGVTGAVNNRLSRLTVSLNGGSGILLADSDDNRIEWVTAADNGVDGISLGGTANIGSNDNRVRNSSASDNDFAGIAATNNSGNNRIERNSFVRNGTFGIAVETASNDSRLKRNTAIGNQQSGIFVQTGTSGTVVRRNVANENGTDPANPQDGIFVDSAAATIARNSANQNGDFGIEGVVGVTDGGGNAASGNGNAAQCLNVVCN